MMEACGPKGMVLQLTIKGMFGGPLQRVVKLQCAACDIRKGKGCDAGERILVAKDVPWSLPLLILLICTTTFGALSNTTPMRPRNGGGHRIERVRQVGGRSAKNSGRVGQFA